MTKPIIIVLLILLLTFLGFKIYNNIDTDSGATSFQKSTDIRNGVDTKVLPKYQKISAQEAKKMLDENTNAILLDVRTDSEYKEKHISGAILIPNYEIEEKAANMLPDKEALILIYCRSGNRSKSVAKKLLELGYTNVYDFGGINSYPYELISE